MKRIFYLVFLASAFFFGQTISGYRYITVSQSKDFANDKFGLYTLLSSKLQTKGYTVLGNDRALWPADAASDPCSVLQGNVENISSLLKNKLRISFVDCRGNAVGSFEGRSNIKEYEEGYQDALTLATNLFPGYNTVVTNADTKTHEVDDVKPKTVTKTDTKVEKVEPTVQNSAQKFSNGSLDLNRIIISDSQFILASADNSVPFAIFKESTKKEIYRVQLQDGTQTLGYLENGNLVIEMPNPDGSFRKETFTRK